MKLFRLFRRPPRLCSISGCQRAERFRGQFAGGLCEVHVLPVIDMCWPDYEPDVRKLLEEHGQ